MQQARRGRGAAFISQTSVPIRIRRSGPVSSAAFAFPSNPVGQRPWLKAMWLNGWFHDFRNRLRTTRDAGLRPL